MANPWFRMYAEFASDPKVQMMPEAYQRRLLMLLCFRCSGNETLQDEEIVFQLRVSPEEWQGTKAEFIARKFIDKDNNILNWDKRQYISDSSTSRVTRHREKKKRECNVSVTPPDTEQNRTESPLPPPQGGGVFKNGSGDVYNIERFLTDEDRENARRAAPGWDQYYLMPIYNAGVKDRGAPKYPGRAYVAWCKSYTKGKQP